MQSIRLITITNVIGSVSGRHIVAVVTHLVFDAALNLDHGDSPVLFLLHSTKSDNWDKINIQSAVQRLHLANNAKLHDYSASLDNK